MMNGTYYPNPTFPGNNNYEINSNDKNRTLPLEEGYIENILNINKGKNVKIYASFTDSKEEKSKVFAGIIEQANKGHLMISDPETGKWYLILIKHLDYIEFDESIKYK